MLINNNSSLEIKDLGKVIKMARLRSGLTQAVVADRVGVTAARISELENEVSGKNSTKLDLVQKIINVLTHEASKT